MPEISIRIRFFSRCSLTIMPDLSSTNSKGKIR